MALVPYLGWLGIGAVAVVVVWALAQRVRSRAVRLGVRCLAVAAALTRITRFSLSEEQAVVDASMPTPGRPRDLRRTR